MLGANYAHNDEFDYVIYDSRSLLIYQWRWYRTVKAFACKYYGDDGFGDAVGLFSWCYNCFILFESELGYA